jgi:hypothetical protein
VFSERTHVAFYGGGVCLACVYGGEVCLACVYGGRVYLACVWRKSVGCRV